MEVFQQRQHQYWLTAVRLNLGQHLIHPLLVGSGYDKPEV